MLYFRSKTGATPVRKLNQQKQTEKGVMYQSEHNKAIAKQLEDKSKYPIFLVKIEIIAPTNQSIKQITSKFNTLSTSQNKFYSVGTTGFNKKKIENKIHSEYSYSWLMPKPHFYLNSQELACIWQPLRVGSRGDLVDLKEVSSGFKIEY
jgi:hypothetical protein